MTRYPATRTAAAQAPAPSGGIDLKTLLITAASSAAAAYTCSRLWAPGTLAAAAFTPVLVAIIREGLSKSTQVVASAVPVRGIVRSARAEGPQLPDAAGAGDWPAADLAADGQPPAGEPVLADDPAARVAQPGEISYHGSATRRRNWRVAIVTGLLGFVVAAVLFTVPELVAGESASGGGRGTTLFGGKQRDSVPPPVTTTTTTTPEAQETVTAPDEEEVVTVPAPTVTTPPPAVTAPEEPGVTTTPVPPPATEPPPVPEPPPAEVPPG